MPSIRCVFVFHTVIHVSFVTAGWVRCRIASGSDKHIGFGLNGTEKTTIIVDILNIIQNVRDTGIHLKVDEESKSSCGPQQRSERQVGRKRTCTCHILMHPRQRESLRVLKKMI